jgi:hypothetical protein
MPGVAEIGAEAAETALTFAPWLVDVPVLGRILLVLSPGGGNDLQAQEQLQKAAEEKKTERKTREQRAARYVLKASDAMQCVETNLMNGSVLLAIGKAILNTVFRRTPVTGPDLLCDKIFTCIEQKTLRQDSPRPPHPKTISNPRPARGHGHGRRSF